MSMKCASRIQSSPATAFPLNKLETVLVNDWPSWFWRLPRSRIVHIHGSVAHLLPCPDKEQSWRTSTNTFHQPTVPETDLITIALVLRGTRRILSLRLPWMEMKIEQLPAVQDIDLHTFRPHAAYTTHGPTNLVSLGSSRRRRWHSLQFLDI